MNFYLFRCINNICMSLTMEQDNDNYINNETVAILMQACLIADQIEIEQEAALLAIYAEYNRSMMKYAEQTNTNPCVCGLRLLSFDATKFGPDLRMTGHDLNSDDLTKTLEHFETTGKTMALVYQHTTNYRRGMIDIYFVSLNNKYYTINITDGKLTYAMETHFIDQNQDHWIWIK